MTQLSYLSAIRVDGADGRDFLHRQLSADINGLQAGASTFACLCQPKGRVIATVLVMAGPEQLWMACAASLADKVTAWLQRFVFRDDVQFVADSGATVVAAEDQAETAFTPLPGLAYAINTNPERVASDPAATIAYRAVELAHGLTWLDADTSEAFLPQMIGADAIGALNYRKGCFPGQEIVARTHYLGKLKQRPVLARSADPVAAPAMTKVDLTGADGETSAQIVDVAADGDGSRLLLVARSQDAVPISKLVADGIEYAVDVEWPAVSSRSANETGAQASATT